MGNLNCAKCCQGSELRQELDLKFSINALTLNRETQSTEVTNCLQKPVVQIQSFWRRYKAQCVYLKLKEESCKSLYFCDEEVFETLSEERKLGVREFSYLYCTGTCYDGKWLGGFRHGMGECVWPDGSRYVGCWSYGYPSGQGTFTYKDGETFVGTWINPYASMKNRSFLEDMLQGRRDGYIWLNCKVKTQYKRLSHKKCLKKIFKFFSEIQKKLEAAKSQIEPHEKKIPPGYQGGWDGDKRSGFGINLWENGDIYLGNWENDMQNGWGKNQWADGSKYLGQYTNNLKEGLGEYIWEDGTLYTGEWKNNIIHGVGRYVWQDGREYLGQWRQGLMSGFGIHKFPDGRRYEGGWKDGKKHGSGFSYLADGQGVKNAWCEGKIKR